MNLFLYLTNFIVPFLILAIIVYGLLMKTNVYEYFIKGARSGFLTVIKIMPTLIGLMVAVGILRAFSGFLEILSSCIGQLTSAIGFPGELVPLTIVKMFSSSAAAGLLLDLYKEFGASFSNRTHCIDFHVMYGNNFLHDEYLFYDCKNQKFPLYIGRCPDCYFCRTCCQRCSGSIHASIDCFASSNMIH